MSKEPIAEEPFLHFETAGQNEGMKLNPGLLRHIFFLQLLKWILKCGSNGMEAEEGTTKDAYIYIK